MSDHLTAQLRTLATLLVADAPEPPPPPSGIGKVTDVARSGRTPVIVGVLVASVLLGLGVLLSILITGGNGPDRTRRPEPAATSPTTTTSSSSVPPPALTLPVPSGWYPVEGNVSLWPEINPGYPYAESAVATVALQAVPTKNCDVPVDALESLGPTDAFVYVRTVFGTAYGGSAPPATEFVPTAPPENAYTKCLTRSPDFLQRVVGFAEGGFMLEVVTATGNAVSPETQQQLVQIVDGLSLAPAP